MPRYTGTIQGGLAVDREATLEFVEASVTRLDLSGTHLAGFTATASTFDACTFTNCVIRRGTLGRAPSSTYRDCRFDGADLRGVQPANVRFERCRFDGARLEKWLCFTAEFVDCHFGGRLSEVVFRGEVFPPSSAAAVGRDRNAFTGNDFRAAELLGVS